MEQMVYLQGLFASHRKCFYGLELISGKHHIHYGKYPQHHSRNRFYRLLVNYFIEDALFVR